MATNKIEEGIRSYLDSLGASTKPVVDREAVKSLKADIKSEKDPIKRLRLLAALDEEQAGRAPDTAGDQAVFVAEAKAWAEREAIPVTAFQSLGVPDEVLREAGFGVTSGGRRPAAGSRRSGNRAPRVPLEDVKAAARKLGKKWKLSEMAAEIDRDAATARNHVNKLVDQGFVDVLGDDPNHDGRGRAPKLYATRP